MARISVITPAFNEAECIGDVIASVATQCCGDIEHIIVDDFSTDSTAEVVRRWQDVLGSVQLVSTDEHVGPCIARNLGFEHSTGKFILFVDADDLLSPRYVNTCLEVLRSHSDVDFVYTDEWYLIERGRRVEYVLRQMYDWNPVILSRFNMMSVTALMRRSVFEQIGGFRDMPLAEDYDFWLAACSLGIAGVRVPEPLFYHRIRRRSRWGIRNKASLENADMLMRNAYGDIPRAGDRRRNVRHADGLRRAEADVLEALGSTELSELRTADGGVLTRVMSGCEE